MKKLWLSLVMLYGFLGVASNGYAVEYVKICSLFGAGFYYLPGSEICMNPVTGDAVELTAGGPWLSILPYPEGKWVTNQAQECAPGGKLVKVGTYKSSDFTPNSYQRVQTAPFPLALKSGEFISKVMISGGFYDPRVPFARHGTNGLQGLCLRSIDPGVVETGFGGAPPANPPYGNGGRPIGCVSNLRILNMPAAYSVTATSAYPSVDNYFLDPAQSTTGGPYTYGSKLVVTTDFATINAEDPFLLLQYIVDPTVSTPPGPVLKSLAGSVSVSVCVDSGSQ